MSPAVPGGFALGSPRAILYVDLGPGLQSYSKLRSSADSFGCLGFCFFLPNTVIFHRSSGSLCSKDRDCSKSALDGP